MALSLERFALVSYYIGCFFCYYLLYFCFGYYITIEFGLNSFFLFGFYLELRLFL